MYSDLFDQLGGGGGGRHHHHGHGSGGSTNGSGPEQPPSLVSCKAGKVQLSYDQERRSYRCVADPSRGEIRLAWKDGALQWQWYDRRQKTVASSYNVSQSYAVGSTFERIPLTDKVHAEDRIYVWTRTPVTATDAAATATASEESKDESAADGAADATPKNVEYEMFWMQEKDDSKEDEIVAQINAYLADPSSARPEGERDAMDTASTAAGAGGGAAAGATGTGAGSGTSTAQVDALSSILENLGMPQSDGGGGSGSASASGGGSGGGAAAAAAGGPSASASGGMLTLADLQGAMAGVQQLQEQQQQQRQGGGPSLAEVVTPAAMTALLRDEGVRARLLEFLPEEQRTPEQLEENLRSPQVQQTLRSLTAALLPDDHGNLDGYLSVIANFQLNPSDGQRALTTSQNPIQAFLDCILKSVEKEKEAEQGGGEAKPNEDETTKGGGGDEDKKDGDTEMKED